MPYPLVIALAVFVVVFGASLLGGSLQHKLPEQHLAPESKRIVDLATALIVTLSAVVLALLVSSAKTSYDTLHDKVKEFATEAIVLDRQLAHYGPGTGEIRARLRSATSAMIDTYWPTASAGQPAAPVHMGRTRAASEDVAHMIFALNPSDSLQRTLQARAIQTSGAINRTSWMLVGFLDTHAPFAFIAIVVAWPLRATLDNLGR